jgi:hypothetical protein
MTLEHPALSEFDHILVERLRPLTMPVDRRFGAIRIGVANGDGDLYRVIETSSLVEAVRVFEALKDLGLVPRRKAGRAMRVFQAA